MDKIENNFQKHINHFLFAANDIRETVDFALLELNQPLTLLQQKLFYMSIAAVGKNEDAEKAMLYKIDIRNVAALTNTDIKSLRQNLKRVVTEMNNMATTLNLRSPVMLDTDGKLKVMYGIYQGMEIDKEDTNNILIRLNYYFRKQILRMKKEYDIEYPLKSIMRLKGGNFTIPLYIYLIAEMAITREKMTTEQSLDSRYDIFIEREDLLRKLNYTNKVGLFNVRTLPTVCNEINKCTELNIINAMPDIIKAGKTVTGYIFHLKINTSKETPIFTRSLLKSRLDLVPDMEYLTYRLKSMGVADSTIKHYQAERNPDRLRIWGNMLYTWHMAGDNQPRYYKKAYSENYFNIVCGNDVEKIFRLVMLNNPQIADEYMRSIDNEYTKRGVPANPNFIKDLLLRLSNEK